ncbi:VanZ family protein [Pseudomonas songnenensis]|uniref:VanZ family protein n=1 Tax=Pseudomonas songnenensis TaxID=1176259 RepID=A0ABX9UXQ9_9PSED|nr:VanZ family protein [Pseudomonas songnenensis]AWM60921.1 VanZ family protein [Stutzerimonas stutzeri]MCQ4301235.1 VanZ family protein [Pseudomonas songnenensis]RMH97815.1 VanZ family protein [Pseudomonas songnenensis]
MPYLRMLPFLIVLAVVLFAGLKPDPVPQLFNQQDKVHHMMGFAALVFTLRLAFPRLPIFWGVGLTLVAALGIEMAQGMLPHRTASRWDMVANVLGVLSGWCGWMLVQAWWRQRTGEPVPE